MRNPKKFIVGVLISLAALVGMVACGPAEAPVNAPPTIAPAAPPAPSEAACMAAMEAATREGDTATTPAACDGLPDAVVTELAQRVFADYMGEQGWEVTPSE